MISYIEQKDHWYSHFYTLPTDERYEMFMNLFEQGVSDDELIKDDFGTISVELKSELINEKQYEKAISMIEKTKESTTTFYEKEFPYLSDFAIEYFLYKKDFAKMQEHLQPFIENPGHGYDMFVPLFDKIRFYQMDELALKLADVLEEPIIESDELIGGAEIDLTDLIFYHVFQEFYQTLGQDKETGSIQQLTDTMKKYNYDEEFFDKQLPIIYDALTSLNEDEAISVFTRDDWANAVQGDSRNALRYLFWSFAVDMLKRGNFHFSLSASIWFPFLDMLSNKKALLEFEFTYKDLEDLISGYMQFFSNKEERGFALTWGIPYIYDFLYDQKLVSKESYDHAQKHVTTMKKHLLKLYKDDIWRFDFVHTWVKPLSVSEESFAEEQAHFHETFVSPKKKTISTSKKAPPEFNQLDLFDELFDEGAGKQQTKAKASQALKKKKRKQAKKQRRKNRKK